MTRVARMSLLVTMEGVSKADGSVIEMMTVATDQMRLNVHHRNVIQSNNSNVRRNTA